MAENHLLTIYRSVNLLVDKPPAPKKIEPPKKPPAIRSKTGLERRQAAGSGAYDASEEVTVESTDGLFTFTVRVVAG